MIAFNSVETMVVVPSEHLEDRFAGFGMTYRIDRVVIDDRLTTGCHPVVASAISAWVSCERYHSAPRCSTLTLPNNPTASDPPSPRRLSSRRNCKSSYCPRASRCSVDRRTVWSD